MDLRATRCTHLRHAAAAAIAAIALALPLYAELSERNDWQLVGQEQLYYSLQEVEPDSEQRQAVQNLIARHYRDGMIVVVQGFACDTGGIEPSQRVAAERAKRVATLLREELGVERQSLIVKPAKVLVAGERPLLRRSELRIYHISTGGTVGWPHHSLWLILAALLIAAAMLAWYLRLYLLGRRRHKHLLSETEEEEFALIISREEMNLMKSIKKNSKKNTIESKSPLSKMVEEEHHDKSFSELKELPVDALTGLTPRHRRLLEEAFGVKTIEDLARLKYSEIARSITTLSKYEYPPPPQPPGPQSQPSAPTRSAADPSHPRKQRRLAGVCPLSLRALP